MWAGVAFDDIIDAYSAGAWKGLQGRLKSVADTLRHTKPENSSPGCDATSVFPEDERISFVFVDDQGPQPSVVRVLQGTSPRPSVGSGRLIRRTNATKETKGSAGASAAGEAGYLAFTVYLFPTPSEPPIFSTYTAIPSSSPIAAGLAQVASTFGGGIGKVVAPPSAQPSVPKQPPEGKRVEEVVRRAGPSLECVVMATLIPEDIRWAQVSVTDNANVGGLLTPDNARRRADRLTNGDQTLTELNQRLSRAFPKEPNASAGTQGAGCAGFPFTGATADPSGCQASLLKVLTETLQGMGVDKRDKAEAIYDMYAALLSSTPQASTQTTYTYGSLTRWTFGLGAGAMAHPNLNQQAKLSGTSVVEDPLNGTMTSVNVYWSFFGGYDETTLTPSCNEKYPRLVFGGVLTPTPGLFVGLGEAAPWPDARNVTLNLGYAVMVATVPVGDLATATKTKRGALGAWFLEFGYSF
ncbi:MAG: hypothetical protein ACHQQS_10540 [Thermoanaerobaculales bacterium]